MAIVEDLRQLSQSENELNEYFKFEFELKLNTLNKIRNTRGVNRLITEGEFKKYLNTLHRQSLFDWIL